MPAPTPTSQLINISGSSLSPIPNSYSPKAAASASFCTCTLLQAIPAAAKAALTMVKKSRLRQPRLGAKCTSPVLSWTAPGKHRPTPLMVIRRAAKSAHKGCNSPVAWAHTACGSGLCSGTSCSENTSPVSDTQTMRRHSTATSMPIKTRPWALSCSGVDGRPRPSPVTGELASTSHCSSSSSRTRALTVDLVRPLWAARRARDSPLCC